MSAGREIGSTDPTGRNSGHDHFDAVHGFAANTALVDDVGQLRVLSAGRSGELIRGVLVVVALWLKMNAEEAGVLRLDRNPEQQAFEGRPGRAR